MLTFSLNGKIGLFQCSLKYTSIQSLLSFDTVTRLIKSVNMEYVPQTCLSCQVTFLLWNMEKSNCPIHSLCIVPVSHHKE